MGQSRRPLSGTVDVCGRGGRGGRGVAYVV